MTKRYETYKYNPKTDKILQMLSEKEASRTFSQCGEPYKPQNFTPNRCLKRANLGKHHPMFE